MRLEEGEKWALTLNLEHASTSMAQAFAVIAQTENEDEPVRQTSPAADFSLPASRLPVGIPASAVARA